MAVAAEPVARALEDAAHVVHARRHGGELLERRAGRRGDDPRERRLARRRAGRRGSSSGGRSLLDRAPERGAFAEHVPLADELVERARPQSLRRAAPSRSRALAAASAKRSRSTIRSESLLEPGHVRADPRLRPDGALSARPGIRSTVQGARSDYERYLNTDELLALQKGPISGCTATSCSSRSSTSRPSSGSSSRGTTPGAAAPVGEGEHRRGAAAAAPGEHLHAVRRRVSSTCSSRCRPGSTRRSARCSGTAAGFDSPGGSELRPRGPARRGVPRGARAGGPLARRRLRRRAASTRSSTSSPKR